MNTKKFLISGLLFAVAVVIVGMVLVANRKPGRNVSFLPSRTPVIAPTQASSESTPAVESKAAEVKSPAQVLKPKVPPVDPPQQNVFQTPKPAKTKPPLQDPLARAAMSLVGADPGAEAYWLEAIFDSSLPKQEREDLIEDLNEEGLSDHKRPGPGDYPLIMNRLAIIEEIAPYSDEFMLNHLQEAYKDLVNLSQVALGGGLPVQ